MAVSSLRIYMYGRQAEAAAASNTRLWFRLVHMVGALRLSAGLACNEPQTHA